MAVDKVNAGLLDQTYHGESFYNRTRFAKFLLTSTEESSIFTKIATRDTTWLNMKGTVQGNGPVSFHYIEQDGQGSTVEFPFATTIDISDYVGSQERPDGRNTDTEYFKDSVKMNFKVHSERFSNQTIKEIELTKDIQNLFKSFEARKMALWLKKRRDAEIIFSFFSPYFPKASLDKGELGAYVEGKMPLALRTVAGTGNLYTYSSTQKMYTQLGTALPDMDTGRMCVQHIYQLSAKISSNRSFYKFMLPPIEIEEGTYNEKTGFAIKQHSPVRYMLVMNSRAAQTLRSDPEYQKLNLATREIFGQASPFTNMPFLGVIGDIWCFEEPLLNSFTKLGTRENLKDVDWSLLIGSRAIGETLFIKHLPDHLVPGTDNIEKFVQFGHGCKTLMYPLEAYNESEVSAEGNALDPTITLMEYGVFHSFTKNEE